MEKRPRRDFNGSSRVRVGEKFEQVSLTTACFHHCSRASIENSIGGGGGDGGDG